MAMVSYKILTTKDAILWDNLVEKCDKKDVHFLAEYAALFEKHLGESAYLFVFEDGDNFVLYPFFKKRINDLTFANASSPKNLFGAQYFDIVSPWYFGGPIFHLKNNAEQNALFEMFVSSFDAYCSENGIVSEFTRFHPILRNHEVLANLGQPIKEEYDVAYVDLGQSGEDILKNMQKSNRNAITKAERNGVTVDIGGEELVSTFHELYKLTMARHNADAFYLFSLEFLRNLVKSFKQNSVIFVARYGGKPVAASIFLYKYGIAHYWLSGSDSAHWKLSPNNILLYKAMLWFKERGDKTFFLMGGSPTLRKFKLSFTNTSEKFYTCRKIHNENAYKLLCKLRDEYSVTSEPEGKFFPYYRR